MIFHIPKILTKSAAKITSAQPTSFLHEIILPQPQDEVQVSLENSGKTLAAFPCCYLSRPHSSFFINFFAAPCVPGSKDSFPVNAKDAWFFSVPYAFTLLLLYEIVLSIMSAA